MDSEQKMRNISEYFIAISKYAEALAFPNYRKGIFEQKNLKNWKVLPKFIYNLSHPFTSPEITGSLFFIFWMILYLVQFLAFFMGLMLLYPILFNTTPFLPPTNIESQSVLVLSVISGIPVGIVAYAWWIETLLAKKNPKGVKLLLPIIVFWALYSVINAAVMQSPSRTLWESSADNLTLTVSLFLMLIPSVSYFVAILFDFTLVILLLIKTVFGGIKSIHEPRPIETILKLAIQDIPPELPEGKPWRLSKLTKAEIIVLLQWAEANREGSEKRTVPAFLVAALIGLALTSDFIRQIIDGFLATLISNGITFLNAKSFWAVPVEVSFTTLLIIPLLAIIVTVVLKNLLALFRNIVAQNLIVEACILAEQAAVEPTLPALPKMSFWEKILFLVNK